MTREDVRNDFLSATVELGPMIIGEECKALGLDPVRLVKAIGHQESTCALDTEEGDGGVLRVSTRWERSYSHGRRYYTPTYSERWGRDAESSWGPLQIMYPNAVRFGFSPDANPADAEHGLANTRKATKVSLRMLKQVLAKTLAWWSVPPYIDRGPIHMIADAWNSGNFRDRFIPYEYISAVMSNYGMHREGTMHP